MVPKSKRGVPKLEVLDKSRELVAFTMRICSNEKNFPKRYRWCMTQKIIDSALNISNYVEMANCVYVVEHEEYLIRKNYQLRALAETYALYNMIEFSKAVFGLETSKAVHWSGMVVKVQTLIRNWKKSDKVV